MNVLSKIGKSLVFSGNRGVLLIRKFAPEILIGVGITSGIAGAVIAVNNAHRLMEVVESTVREGRRIQKQKTILSEDEYPINIQAMDSLRNLGNLCTGTVDVMAVPLLLGAVSVSSILAAHGMMRNRYAALSVAYTAIERSYAAYRGRVQAEVGEETEQRIFEGKQDVEITYKEDGKEITKTVQVMDPNHRSPYCRWFDETSSQWQKIPEYNLLFLQAQQNWANNLLHARGHIFLNEVYDMIGVKRSQAGTVVGWVISKDGDNCIDFGLYDISSDAARAFINGYEKSILLDFNVDGVIYDKI